MRVLLFVRTSGHIEAYPVRPEAGVSRPTAASQSERQSPRGRQSKKKGPPKGGPFFFDLCMHGDRFEPRVRSEEAEGRRQPSAQSATAIPLVTGVRTAIKSDAWFESRETRFRHRLSGQPIRRGRPKVANQASWRFGNQTIRPGQTR